MLYNWLASQASQMNWWITAFFILGMLPQIYFSYRDNTFAARQSRRVDLPLAWHWGVLIGDPLLAILMGRVWADLNFSAWSILFLIASIIISVLLHWSWRDISGHMFYRGDFTSAGLCHLIFFIMALELIFEFIFTPMPRGTVLVATHTLLVFAPFAVFEPGLAEWWRKRRRDPGATWFWRSFISLIGMWAAILLVAYYKT